MAKKRWSDLSDRQRAVLVVCSAVELVLTTVALVDLARRPSDQVEGSKVWWTLACFVQPVGPVAYLAMGRAQLRPSSNRPRVRSHAGPSG